MLEIEEKLRIALKYKNKNTLNNVFEEIYYEYGNLVGFVISKYVQDKGDIEELINDVFLSFFNNLYKIKLKNIKSYLTTAAKNKAISYLRKNKNSYILDDNCISKIVEQSNTLYYQIIRSMKDILSDEEINLIIEHTVYDVSFKELAKKSNKPISTISTQYYSAINKYKTEELKNETK